LPSGTVTLLFTDIEGSTKLLHELGEQAYAEALAEHRAVLRGAFASRGGVEVDTQGDAFFYAFPEAREACRAAQEGRDALRAGRIRVRMGLHTGTPHLTGEGYVGEVVHKGARIAAAGHGGQVLLSLETRTASGVEATDLGEHRLKDFTEAVAIFQLGTERFPPLKTISNTNLPRPASSFVGREHEVSRVVAALKDGARLLTLTGPGGSGKTRLAIESASELVSEHRNGVFWVELAPLRDPALVSETIATTLGAMDGLADHIQEKEMLLVLDNFEQVVDAAPELPKLLKSCANLRVLVTSRELLRVQGEVEFPVLPLARAEAVELFCRRSGLDPDDTIAELCRRLDNLPLAVELAAARTSVLSPAQILDRLATRLDLFKGGRDADPRQATLRGTIEWSHDLLTEVEQRLFARLAAFAGGTTLAAAEVVADADLDTLQSLVDKSLVRHTGERFWMLETIREFAVERLDASGEGPGIRRRHAEHFLDRAETVEEYHLRGYSNETLDMFAQEHDNLRASIDWFDSSGETQNALRLTGVLVPFWRDRGFPAEGWRRVSRAIDSDPRPTPARALALEIAAELAGIVGNLSTALRYAGEAVSLSRTLGDARRLAGSLQSYGIVQAEIGEWESAREAFEDSVRAFRNAGDEHSALWAERSLAWALGEIGDLEGERRLHEKNLVAAREFDDEALETLSANALAMVALRQGRVQDAFDYLRKLLPFWRDYGDLLETPFALARAARAFAVAGDSSIAARILSCTQTLLESRGIHSPMWARTNAETLEMVREGLEESEFADAWEAGRNMAEDEAFALAIESLK
jgi:predicted ATPase